MRTVPEQLFFLPLMIEEDEVSKQLPFGNRGDSAIHDRH